MATDPTQSKDVCAQAFRPTLPVFVETLALDGETILSGVDDLTTHGIQVYSRFDASGAPAQFDALLITIGEEARDALVSLIRALRLKIHRFGTLYLQTTAVQWADGNLQTTLETGGLGLYRGWTLQDGTYRAWNGTDGPATGTVLLRFHRTNYDPVVHARSFLRDMGFGMALSILHDVPEHWFKSEEQRGLHATERLICFLAQDRFVGPRLRLQHMVSALHAYNRACTWVPTHTPAYQGMAAFWKGIGRADVGRRLLQTVNTILPTPEVEEEIKSYTDTPPTVAPYSYPPFDPAWPLRILYICHVESDYGSDLLYDGLRRTLGAENVIDYPWKPTVHGQDFDQAFGYPCTFSWPDGPVPVSELIEQAESGAFDVVLFSDTTGTLARDAIAPLLHAARSIPLFILDMWDECGNFQEDIQRTAGIDRYVGYFKREMLRGVDYGPNVWPLTFAYANDKLTREPQWEKRQGVFWAGKLIGGARRLQLSWLEKQVPVTGGWGTPYSQAEYAALLRDQAIGLCLFGNGFDTVRYWELPAHGVMLLAERSPLVIPNNFEDGKQAVFYDHAGDLRDKVSYYLEHPEAAVEVARAGHAHLLEHHTATARARQLLGQVQARLRELRETGS